MKKTFLSFYISKTAIELSFKSDQRLLNKNEYLLKKEDIVRYSQPWREKRKDNKIALINCCLKPNEFINLLKRNYYSVLNK